jgi:hypothetical protein
MFVRTRRFLREHRRFLATGAVLLLAALCAFFFGFRERALSRESLQLGQLLDEHIDLLRKFNAEKEECRQDLNAYAAAPGKWPASKIEESEKRVEGLLTLMDKIEQLLTLMEPYSHRTYNNRTMAEFLSEQRLYHQGIKADILKAKQFWQDVKKSRAP